jgi:hypothetical protein
MPIINVSTTTATDWWEDLIKESESKKKPAVFKDDPVAMACAVHRSWKTHESSQFQDLGSVPIESQDRDCAEAIRRYYGAKFVEMALRGHQVSEFRLKLAEVLDGRRQLAESEIGMLYRLPYFYDEDTDTDWIYANTASSQTLEYYRGLEHVVKPLTLTPLRQVLRSQRGGDGIKYWFVTQHGHPALISVAKSNPLNAMMSSLFELPQLKVQAHLKIGARRGHNVQDQFHFELINPRLLAINTN